MIDPQKKFLQFKYIIPIALLIFIPLISKPPEIWEDTAGYISFASYRPPLYPFFLWLFHGLGAYQFIAVKWAQAVINLIALLYAGNWMSKRLELPNFLICIILLLTVTSFFLHIQFSILGIISEAIAFPLFILTFIALVESFSNFEFKNIVMLVIACNLLILTRDQFYYMYPILFLLVFFGGLKKLPLKKCAAITVVILSSIVANVLIVGIYHHTVNGHFGESSAVGEVFLPPALYLANKDDAQYFKDTNDKEIFLRIEKNLSKENLSYASAPEILNPPLQIRMSSAWYNIKFNRIKSVAIQCLPNNLTPYAASHVFIDISKTLYTHELMKNFKFYFWRTVSAMGGIWIFLSMSILLFSILYRAITDEKWNPKISQIVIFLSLSITIANAGFVSLFSVFDPRYYYYVYFLYLILAGLSAKSVLEKCKANDSRENK